jgi:hypothetical protein
MARELARAHEEIRELKREICRVILRAHGIHPYPAFPGEAYPGEMYDAFGRLRDG